MVILLIQLCQSFLPNLQHVDVWQSCDLSADIILATGGLRNCYGHNDIKLLLPYRLHFYFLNCQTQIRLEMAN